MAHRPGGPTTFCDRLRDMARRPGLFIYAGLGSRGIAWSALGARVLAAAVASAPSPLPAPLRDAVDPARFSGREWRRVRHAPAGGASRVGDEP